MQSRTSCGIFAFALLLQVWGCKSTAPTAPMAQPQDTSKFAVWDYTRFAPPNGKVAITGRGFSKIRKGLYVLVGDSLVRPDYGDSSRFWISLPNLAEGSYQLSVTIDSLTVQGPGRLVVTNLPIIDSIVPNTGVPGDQFIIYYKTSDGQIPTAALNGQPLQVSGQGTVFYSNQRYLICAVPSAAKSGFVSIRDNGTPSADSARFTLLSQTGSNFRYQFIQVSLSGIIGQTVLDTYSPPINTNVTRIDTLGFSVGDDGSRFIRSRPNHLDTMWLDAGYYLPLGNGSQGGSVLGFVVLDSISRRVRVVQFTFNYGSDTSPVDRTGTICSIQAHDLPYSIDGLGRISVSLTGSQLATRVDSVGYIAQRTAGLSGYHWNTTLASFSGLTTDAQLTILLSP